MKLILKCAFSIKQGRKILLMAMLVLPLYSYADTIKIGLRAIHGIEKSMAQWQKTADYLSEKIPEHNFVFEPYVGLTELMYQTEQNQFDFVLSNPSSYIDMNVKLGASAILTLKNKRQGKPYTQFGSVIFVRKDNDNINSIKDLYNKNFMAVSMPAFGGWRVAVRELLNNGFDVYQQAKHVGFSGGIQEDVVSAVQLGLADVGVVRTDMLERMSENGLIELDDFKIINPIKSDDFPFFRSTQLYPEWPLVKMPDTSLALSEKVVLVLLTMPQNHPAAISGGYVGWTTPEDYQPVRDLMKELQVGVYKDYHDSSLGHFINAYLEQLIIALIVFLFLIVIVVYILSINKKLNAAKNGQAILLEELESRVEARTKDLLLAKEEAERSSNAKSEFLSSMSHELRTPMNAILGFAQILEYDITNKKMDSLGPSVNEILVSGEHLLELINDVLDLAKIGAGTYALNIQKVVVSKPINEVVRLLKVLSHKRNINLICDVDGDDSPAILVDHRSLKQVLINIITNAIKYNNDGGEVSISVHQHDNEHCTISIKDTGDGIPPDCLDSIFEPFERASHRTAIEGSGVGLSVTKNLMELMDGKISVESELGTGSTFSLTFKVV